MKILFLTIAIFLHPVHVSLTGIEYSSANRTYSIFVKLYSADLESDISLSPGCKNGTFSTPDEKYGNYLCDRVVIREDGKKVELVLTRVESDGREHRFTLVARGGKRVETVEVLNRIMTRLYDDQANMVLFRYDDIEEEYKFTSSDTLRNYFVK